MTRRRINNRHVQLGANAGLAYTTTVIVQFHHLFVTKVDGAYAITCFYSEAPKTVTQTLEVSMLPTTELNNQLAMPTCSYEVSRIAGLC